MSNSSFKNTVELARPIQRLKKEKKNDVQAAIQTSETHK